MRWPPALRPALYRSRLLRHLYERPGDRVGFHYDTSHYGDAGYTVLLGLEDQSPALLECLVHSRERHREIEHLDVQRRQVAARGIRYAARSR
jgi:hypothetical protein